MLEIVYTCLMRAHANMMLGTRLYSYAVNSHQEEILISPRFSSDKPLCHFVFIRI